MFDADIVDSVVAEIENTLEGKTNWGFGRKAVLSKICAHSDRLAKFLSGQDLEITPANLEIWPSLTCNARCTFCPYVRNLARFQADRSQNTFLMPTDLFEKIISEFQEIGGLSVNLTGGGEPTMHPKLARFGEIAYRHGIAWGLFSNGYHLLPSVVSELLANSPSYIRVSVNSWSAETHDKTYHLGLDAYENIKDNIIFLTRNAPTDTAVGIGYIFTDIDFEALESISRYISQIHDTSGRLDYVAIRPSMIYYKNGLPVERQPHSTNFKSVPDRCREMLEETCRKRGIILHINDDSFDAVAVNAPPSTCLSTSWATSCTENGTFYLLSEANGSPNPILKELAYGQIEDKVTFKEIWYGEHRKRLYRQFAEGTLLAPSIHKLTGLDQALVMLRKKFGILAVDDANEIASRLSQRPKPMHWMFI